MTEEEETTKEEQTEEEQVFDLLTKIHGDDPFTQIINQNTTSQIVKLLAGGKGTELLSSIQDVVKESWGSELAAWHTAKAILLVTGRERLIPGM